ncbi:unnamed protein product [Cladocopium goreaui]|uniref:ER membrane protein complex subunit 7 beta-sandwich domain-containing protein n=1 Tax=Cladocopium goreaui TaxID=2562237 RepID=A0A9P1C6W1_9DINO|nr:unnamed protein product [Cladocopium goreaui]
MLCQSFLSRLPADQFLQEEDGPCDPMIWRIGGSKRSDRQRRSPRAGASSNARDACEKAPETLAQVKRLPSVLKCTKVQVLLPAAIKLEDWIERRIGAEVAVETDAAGQRVCRLMGSEPLPRQESRNREKDRSEEFFRMLPKDSFLPEEEKLRMAIFDFLAGWSAQELATLQRCAQNPAVAEAKRGMFASHAVNFKDWIERRIGGELILRPDPAGRGELEIHLTPAARPVVAERVALLQARKPPGIWPAPARPPPHSLHSAPPIPAPMPHMVASGGSERNERSNRQERRRDKERKEPQHRDEASKQSFFDKLPAEELLEKELELRQILLDSLDIYFQKHPAGEGPALSMIAGQTKAYQEIKSSFLKGVSLREWVDRRIGGEVATKMGSNGQVIIFPRDREGQVNADVADEVMEAADLLDGKAQDFFDNLPPDGFLSQEEVLREAILNFLEAWDDVSAPPTLKVLQRNSEVELGCPDAASISGSFHRARPLRAQTGQIKGRVSIPHKFQDATSAAGAGLAAARVILDGGVLSTLPASDGHFALNGVSAGPHLLQVVHPLLSFDPVRIEAVENSGAVKIQGVARGHRWGRF